MLIITLLHHLISNTQHKYLKQENLPLDFGKYAAKNILIIEETKKEDNALARTIKL